MRKKLTHNLGLKLLSVGVAFLLWLVVVSVDDPITSRPYNSIPVELINTQTITQGGKVFEVQNNSDMVNINVTAKRSVLGALSRDNFKATADMSKLDPATNTVPIEVRSNRYADKIDDIVLKSKNVVVAVENLKNTQYTVAVDTKGSPADGCVVGNITLDKNILKVSGPESIVSTIASVRTVVNVANISTDIATEEMILLYDENDDVIDTANLTLSMTTAKIHVAIWKSKEVPLTFGYHGIPADGFGTTGLATCSLASVQIAGPSSNLKGVESIAIPSTAVDITNAKQTVEANVDITRYLPDGIVFATQDFDPTVVIKVSIEPLQTKKIEVPAGNISVINVPENMTTEMGGIGEVVVIEVKGLGDFFTNLDPSIITGTVDLQQIELPENEEVPSPGEYELPVTFQLPEGITGGEDEIKVKVVLRKSEG